MMIKIGDKVKFLNAVGGGIVTSFSGKNRVNVEDEQGFEIPTLISQLVLVDDRPDTGKQQQMPQIPVPEKGVEGMAEQIVVEPSDAPEFYFAFVPENASNPVGGEMKAYLVNGSRFTVLYHYSHLCEGEYSSVKSGKLEAGTKLLLENFSQNELNDLPDFYFQLLFFREKSKNCEMPVYKRIKVNPVKFYKEKSFQRNVYFSTDALLMPVSNSDFEDELQDLTHQEIRRIVSEKQEPKIKKELNLNPDLVEVDLHIHELLVDTRGLSNHEMLEIQMKTFREKLDEAIKSGVKRIVFIHGLGNGTLKQEIRKELSLKFRKYAFQDASFQEYGFGATMVVLRK